MPYISDEQRLENRRKLLRCTRRLFIREGEKLTTQMVCAEAGVGKGTLFTYFESKERLLHEAYLEADQNACRLTWRNLDLSGSRRDIICQLIMNAMEWPLSFPEEVLFSSCYNDLSHHDLYSADFDADVLSPLDYPGIPERLLGGISSPTIREYAKHAASANFFSFMLYLARHPETAADTQLTDYVVDKISCFFE